MLTFDDLRPCNPRSWAFFMFTAYVPSAKDTPDLELVDEGNGVWMVVLYGRDKYPCPEGFEALQHYSDDLDCWGKDFSSRDEALAYFNLLAEQYRMLNPEVAA